MDLDRWPEGRTAKYTSDTCTTPNTPDTPDTHIV